MKNRKFFNVLEGNSAESKQKGQKHQDVLMGDFA